MKKLIIMVVMVLGFVTIASADDRHHRDRRAPVRYTNYQQCQSGAYVTAAPSACELQGLLPRDNNVNVGYVQTERVVEQRTRTVYVTKSVVTGDGVVHYYREPVMITENVIVERPVQQVIVAPQPVIIEQSVQQVQVTPELLVLAIIDDVLRKNDNHGRCDIRR